MVTLTREQLEERLAALHRASLELVGDLSLETVLERIVNLAREQVGARYAALGVTGEDGELARFIHVGMTPEEVARMPHVPLGRGLLGVLQNERRGLRVSDIQADPRSVGFPAGHPDMHSFLGMPILRGDQHLGQIYLTDKLYHDEFTESDERVLEILAAYAAVAITNARFYENVLERDQTLTERNEDLALINDIGTVLACSLDMDDVLESTLMRVMAYLRVEAGEIFLRGDNAKEFCMALHHGPSEIPFWTRDCFKLGEGIVGKTAKSAEPMFNVNPADYVRFLRREMLAVGFRCFSLLPLMARAEVVGVMVVATYRECMLGEREINLLLAIANWAGITIENARLLRQDRRLAVLEERERIGMDLHDGIIQSIYGVGLVLEHAKLLAVEDPRHAQSRIQLAIKDLNETIRDIRSYILDLRPRQLGNENLMMGLKRLVTEYRANTLSEAALSGNPDDLNDLRQDHALALFHICQESLANVAKHAAARKVDIFIWKTDDRVLMEIRDDGNGFDLEKMTMTLGHGLSNIYTRAHNVGGDVEITSTIGEGTSILAWVPRTGK